MPTDWEQNPKKLTLFHKYLEMASELLNPQSDYYVVQNLINVMERFFSNVSPSNDQIKSLVHTLGTMATTWNTDTKSWNVPIGSWTTDGKIVFDDPASHWDDSNWMDDLYRVAAQYQPILNTIALKLDTGGTIIVDQGTANEFTLNSSNYIYDSAVFMTALLNENGVMQYVLEVVDTTDKFSEIFAELYQFLGEPLIKNFKNSTSSRLWTDVTKLMAGQVQVLTRNNHPEANRDKFQSLGFQYNDAK
jgi:hypothetical protein